MSGRAKIVSLILLTALLGGAVSVFAKIALVEIPPFTFTFTRFLFASLILLPFYVRVRKPIGGDFLKITCISFLAMGNVVLFSFGIQRTSAGVAQALYTFSPILTIIFSALILRSNISRGKAIGVVVGFLGALVIGLLPLLENGTGSATVTGNALIILAVVFVTLYTVYSKPLQRTYHPIEITTFFSLTTVAILFPLFLFDLRSHPFWWSNLSSEGVFGLVYTGVIGTALYYLLVQYIVKIAEPVLASMVLYIQPFAAIFWAYIFLRETISPLFLAGIALALTGVWLATRQNARAS